MSSLTGSKPAVRESTQTTDRAEENPPAATLTGLHDSWPIAVGHGFTKGNLIMHREHQAGNAGSVVTAPLSGEPQTIADEDAIAFWHPHLKRSQRDQRGVDSIRRALETMTAAESRRERQ